MQLKIFDETDRIKASSEAAPVIVTIWLQNAWVHKLKKSALLQEQLTGSETGGTNEREKEGENALEEVGQLTEEQDVKGTLA